MFENREVILADAQAEEAARHVQVANTRPGAHDAAQYQRICLQELRFQKFQAKLLPNTLVSRFFLMNVCKGHMMLPRLDHLPSNGFNGFLGLKLHACKGHVMLRKTSCSQELCFQ